MKTGNFLSSFLKKRAQCKLALAINILVPTPSVADTKTGFLQLYGLRSNNEPKPPIFLNPLIVDPLIFVLFESFDI